MSHAELEKTIAELAEHGRGILAADESAPTASKRLASIGVESNEENRRAYRDLLFTTPNLNEFISGIILFEETLYQKTADGTPFTEYLKAHNIVPGIKVDKGVIPLTNAPGDKITQGLDGLGDRLVEYKKAGARFTKWRAVLPISAHNPTPLGSSSNAAVLARYAAIAQENGFVPIVEPEILIDGDHSLARCEAVSEEVLHNVFYMLAKHHVTLEHMILKPSMVISGKDASNQANFDEVAEATLRVFKRTVPAAVGSINFLSGGQTEVQATEHLDRMNKLLNKGYKPWNLSFSYARALQNPALNTWGGKTENVAAAQQALYKRAKLNGAAACGEYSAEMETL